MPDQSYIDQWGPGPHEAADALICNEDDEVLLIRRSDGSWAMPGGFLNPGETPVQAAIREAFEETTARLYPKDLLGTIRADSPDRDPRAHINTTVHVFAAPDGFKPVAGDDAQVTQWWAFQAIPHCYADHRELIHRGIEIFKKSSWLQNYAKYLNVVSANKQKMVDRSLTIASCHCPKCGGKDSLVIRLDKSSRDRTGFHARWACKTDGCGFAGME